MTECKTCKSPCQSSLGYCDACIVTGSAGKPSPYSTEPLKDIPTEANITMAQKYPQYYKPVPKGLTEADTYVVNFMFPIRAEDDPTGCVLHARKKLLIPGSRTGGKTFYQDIKEARDTLNRFLELMKPGE